MGTLALPRRRRVFVRLGTRLIYSQPSWNRETTLYLFASFFSLVTLYLDFNNGTTFYRAHLNLLFLFPPPEKKLSFYTLYFRNVFACSSRQLCSVRLRQKEKEGKFNEQWVLILQLKTLFSFMKNSNLLGDWLLWICSSRGETKCGIN